jgi:hypothetical protein
VGVVDSQTIAGHPLRSHAVIQVRRRHRTHPFPHGSTRRHTVNPGEARQPAPTAPAYSRPHCGCTPALPPLATAATIFGMRRRVNIGLSLLLIVWGVSLFIINPPAWTALLPIVAGGWMIYDNATPRPGPKA